jgi:hypothetical protein
MRTPSLLCLATLSVLACGRRSDKEKPSAPAVDTAFSGPYGIRDSAGVTIIADSAPVWKAGEEWIVDKGPSLDIGVTEGDERYEFAEARGPVRLSDGRIAVANMKTTEIRFFDAKGRFLKTVGRQGQGPGEFEQLWRLNKIAGDSLMALEPVSLTSIYTSAGTYVRRFRLDKGYPGFTNIWWLGRLDAGYLVAMSLARRGTRSMSQDELKGSGESEGAVVAPKAPFGYHDSLTHFLYTMDGRLVDSIGSFPGQPVGAGPEFAPSAAYAFSGDRFYHTPGERIDIREFVLNRTTAGTGLVRGRPMRVARIIRLPARETRFVTDADREPYIAERVAAYKRSGRAGPTVEASVRRATRFAEVRPAHANQMRVDPDGNIWLKHWTADPAAAERWSVIDSTGVWLGDVDTPLRFKTNEIGRNYVLGLWVDAYDVQHVRMYTIRKP